MTFDFVFFHLLWFQIDLQIHIVSDVTHDWSVTNKYIVFYTFQWYILLLHRDIHSLWHSALPYEVFIA